MRYRRLPVAWRRGSLRCMDTDTAADDEQHSPHPMTVRLPDPLYERLRTAAFVRHKHMSEILVEAVEAKLAELEAAA
jgi:hypothetical protein